MRAISISNHKVGFLKDRIIPSLSSELNVLVKVYYAGICRTDIAVAKGTIPVTQNTILGHEFCGEVVSIFGETRNQLQIGDIVSADPMKFGKPNTDVMCGVNCDGAFAEYIAVPERAIIKLPNTLSSVSGAYLEPVAAALAPFKHLTNKADCVCLFGDNRIARLTEQIGVMLGYTNIERVYDISAIKECSYDVIIETQPEHIVEYIKALKPQGKLILKSRGYTPIGILPNDIAMKEITICGARYGSFNEAVDVLSSGMLDTKDLFGDVYSLEDFTTAFAAADQSNAKKIFFRVCAE